MPTLSEVWLEIEPLPARRLLVGAIEAFATNGYHGTSTRDIASAAGMSPAGMYVHFRSKEELLFKISFIGHQRCLDMLGGAAERGGTDPEPRLRAVIGDFAAWHASHHTTARVIQYQHEALSEAHKRDIVRLRRKMEALVRGILTDGVKRGVFEVSDIGGTGLAMLSAGIDVARWYRDGHSRTPQDIGRLYGDLAVRTVRRI